MSQELRDLLRSVLKEELEPIRDRLDRVEQTQQKLSSDVGQIQKDVARL
ncbi:low complexity, contains internal repeats QQVlQQDVAQLQAG domain protein [Geobacillus kaustophilus]|uniref:Low complexity, contains internal repeats QQVlQQDVAQLQAG domain protein n=2 Tax=Geobacillus TaxID=129337 RepID=A0A0D8BUY2_GEOKU|nr:low complexity, contains internal repeats QQVlQQDVAQLQAG domain protein [Geobacillus kaustophilus]